MLLSHLDFPHLDFPHLVFFQPPHSMPSRSAAATSIPLLEFIVLIFVLQFQFFPPEVHALPYFSRGYGGEGCLPTRLSHPRGEYLAQSNFTIPKDLKANNIILASGCNPSLSQKQSRKTFCSASGVVGIRHGNLEVSKELLMEYFHYSNDMAAPLNKAKIEEVGVICTIGKNKRCYGVSESPELLYLQCSVYCL